MKPAESPAGKTARPNLLGTELGKTSKKRVEATIEIQKEIADRLAEMNQAWFERATAETNLASVFGAKLASARSLPDVTDAYQQWITKRMQMAGEDINRFVVDSQKFIDATGRLLSGGWASASS